MTISGRRDHQSTRLDVPVLVIPLPHPRDAGIAAAAAVHLTDHHRHLTLYTVSDFDPVKAHVAADMASGPRVSV